MKQQSLKKSAFPSLKKADKIPLATNLFNELVDMLYRQNAVAITTQLLAGLCLIIGLWEIQSPHLIITWLIYMLTIFTFWYGITLFYRKKKRHFKQYHWLVILALCILLSGIGWGVAGSILIPANHLFHQAFVVILLFSITSTSIAFFSPIILIYSFFLFSAFIPFEIWLFAQGVNGNVKMTH